jgi:hypothetical protein
VITPYRAYELLDAIPLPGGDLANAVGCSPEELAHAIGYALGCLSMAPGFVRPTTEEEREPGDPDPDPIGLQERYEMASDEKEGLR